MQKNNRNEVIEQVQNIVYLLEQEHVSYCNKETAIRDLIQAMQKNPTNEYPQVEFLIVLKLLVKSHYKNKEYFDLDSLTTLPTLEERSAACRIQSIVRRNFAMRELKEKKDCQKKARWQRSNRLTIHLIKKGVPLY